MTARQTSLRIRPATLDDTPAIIDLDTEVTGVQKEAYWRDLMERYLAFRTEDRFVLVAESDTRVVGFVIGEIRAWEFGSEPCGWVFAVSVSPDERLHGVGADLLREIESRFRAAGVGTMRTMLSRRNHLLMSFFRAQGLMAGPYIQLEKSLDDDGAET